MDMELEPIPSIIHTSSSPKKKKSKKEKRRKHSEVSASSLGINGSKISPKKKRKKDKKKEKKEKKERAKDASIESGPSSLEPVTANSQELSPPSAAEIESALSQQKSQTNSTQPSTTPGSVFSLVARSPSDSSKLKKSPYQIKTILGTVALLPASLPEVPKHIQSLLHSLLLMYDARMGGVLLSLEEGVKLLPVVADRGGDGGLVGGRIIDDLPYVHYRFQARGLLFCPAVGMKLTGQVVECTPTFVTLTTHHILSTKISTERLHERGYVYDSKTLAWMRERDFNCADHEGDGDEEGGAVLGPSASIYLDDCVEFVVERIHECGGYISLDGTHPSLPSQAKNKS